MKKRFLFFCLISFFTQSNIYGQLNTTKLTSVLGVQAGLSGINIHKEIPITESIVLRPEIGLGFDLYYSSGFDFSVYTFMPKIALDTKWYYNLKNRNLKGRKTEDNAANFFALNFVHFSNLFKISNYNPQIENQIQLVPNWGFRRNLGKHFNYEFALGYRISFEIDSNNRNDGLLLDFKIGYKFN